MTSIGTLGSPRRAEVDERGGIALARGLRCDWIAGADDRWHSAATDVAVRRRRLVPAPAFETSMHVPSGDAIQRVYAVGGPGDLVVLEVENASPVPFVLGIVLRGCHNLEHDESVLRVDGRASLLLPRRPSRWAAGRDGEAVHAVTAGEATDAPLTHERAEEIVLLWPLTHRTVARVAFTLSGQVPDGLSLPTLPSADDAVAGWVAQLARGMQVQLPEERLQAEVDTARADALLAAAGASRHDAALVVALEDWGFDAEAAAGWPRLGWRARRAASRRRPTEGWRVLRDVRDRLLREGKEPTIELLPGLTEGWHGNLDVREAPTRHGRVSYSVRWHGDHAALLWEVTGASRPVTLTAPALDPAWSTSDATGEALLGDTARRAH